VAAVAETQLGVISRQQLREQGLSDTGIAEAVARGNLHPIFHSVFGVGHGPLTIHARLLSATMACGNGSVVSHGTAGWLLALRDRRPLDVDVIAPVESGRKIRGVRRRFVPPPGPQEVEVRAGVPTTDASRTIVDNAGILGRQALSDLIEEAAARRVLNIPRIDAILDGPPRRGARNLLRQLEPWRRYKPGIHLRSRMEAKLLPLLTRAGLPVPECNTKLRIGGSRFEIDFLWRKAKLVVETDGGRTHDNPRAGARDSKRNRALASSGYHVRRIGWEEFRDRPDAVMAELRPLLSVPR
jgi:very-short-patch-repair endonuclease